MATVYERLLKFYEKRPDFRFGKKRTKLLGSSISIRWNKKYKEKPPIIQQIEGGETFMVRNYPDYFTHTIDRVIQLHYGFIQKHIEFEKNLPPKAERKKLRQQRKLEAANNPKSKTRKRIPVTPAYRAKPKSNGKPIN